MKTWALGAAAAMAMMVAMAACGGSSSTGTGAATTTTKKTTTTTASSSSTSSSGTGTGGGTAGDPCTDGSDCTTCADFNTCYDCNKVNHAAGEMLLNTFIGCELCTACYTVCDGATAGCSAAPPSKDACDMGAPSMPGAGTTCGNSMGGCIKCAQAGTCASDLTACKNSPDCIAFNNAIQTCPTN